MKANCQMSEDVAEIVRKIIAIPRLFEETQKKVSDLLLESGYLDNPEAVTIDSLVHGFRESPESVNSWLAWSDNKRSDAGWYFQNRKETKYAVGYFPRTNNVPEQEYTDAFIAAAHFVKHELEDFGESVI
jgi:hypothetical protein